MSGKFTSKSELSKAKNHGAAHGGTHHWIMMFATSAAAVPLVIWFVYSIVSLIGKGSSQVTAFFGSSINATLMALVIFISFYHAALGLQTVIEDYVHGAKKVVTLFVVKTGLLALGIACILAILKLHLA